VADEHSLLLKRLQERIRTEGPLTFAEFMEAALYDPEEGFYARLPVGERAHFVTSPHVSPAFGRLVAAQVEEFWELLDRPDPFPVIEAGAGDGTLAQQILASFSGAASRVVRYLPVERSAAGREALRALGLEPAASLEEVSPVPAGCVLANELLDNLPFHWFRGTADGVAEIRVGLGGQEQLMFVQGDVSREDLTVFAPDLGRGDEAVVSPGSVAFVERGARVLDRGYIWIVDYGFTMGERATAPHAYREHRVDPDVLSEPGSRDITAGVNFETLARAALRLGLQVWGPVLQREALLNLGFRGLEEEARARQVEAIAARRGIDALRTYSDRTRANLLLAPEGLGGFFVLCLGVGVDRPPRSIRGSGPG
jgi:SAM-dependent MidA family methyltransferase